MEAVNDLDRAGNELQAAVKELAESEACVLASLT